MSETPRPTIEVKNEDSEFAAVITFANGITVTVRENTIATERIVVEFEGTQTATIFSLRATEGPTCYARVDVEPE